MAKKDSPTAKQIWALLWEAFDAGSKKRKLSKAAREELESGRGYFANISQRAKKPGWWNTVNKNALRCARRAGTMSAYLAGPDGQIEQIHVHSACAVLEWETAQMKHKFLRAQGDDFDLDFLDGVC